MEIEMLQESRLRFWCTQLLIPAEAVDALVQVQQKILADDQLLQVFNAFYDKNVLQHQWHREWGELPIHPMVQEKLGQQASLFYLLGYLSALPEAEREYRRQGIPLTIFLDTMRDITLWLDYAHDLHGEWRFDQFSWIWRHVDCQLFRLGRLQFMLSEFPGKVTGFRHRKTGQVLLLGDPEMPLRPDGYAEGAGGKPSGEDPWFAVFEATPAGWRGNRIAPQGFTLREESFLVRSEWERVLSHGETVLDLHIPRGDKMTMKECHESFKKAFEFFPTFWPDRPFKGVYCHTWFFTPQLQQILPMDSNLVRFQREFYLYPHPGGPNFLWNYVFGERYPDATTAPRNTSLRREVLDWLANGGELFDLPGLMLHSPEHWGEQPYYPTEIIQREPIVMPEPEPIPDYEKDDEEIDDNWEEPEHLEPLA